MNQKEFSNQILNGLIEKFRFFENELNWKNKEIVEIRHFNPSENICLWIDTFDAEITIGLTDKEEKFDWHFHIDNETASGIKEKIEFAIRLIDKIIKNKEKIVFSSEEGFYLTDDFELELKFKKDQEVLEYKYWNEY